MIGVYKYELKRPTANESLVREQLRLAHEYRNKLIEIERARRASSRAAIETHEPYRLVAERFVALERTCEEMRASIAKKRAESRSRSETEAERCALASSNKALREERKALLLERRNAYAIKSVKEALARAEAVSNDAIKEARANSGLYWGTYLLAEASHAAAKTIPLFDGARPNDPPFERWDGTGQLGVQLQKGLDTTDVHGSDLRLRIGTGEGVWRKWERTPPRKNPKKLARHERWRSLHFRVGTEANGRAPVWAVFPLSYHRHLPPNAAIKWAVVNVRKYGPREEWTVQLTIDTGDHPLRAAEREGVGTVALNPGWRLLDDGSIRVATAVDEEGNVKYHRLTPSHLYGWKKVAELAEIRDRAFNGAKAVVAKYLSALGALDAWMVEAGAETMANWRSIPRLVAFQKRWGTEALSNPVYASLEAWAYHDHHLWSWMEGLRLRTLRRRKNDYRVLGAELAEKYARLILDETDYRELVERPELGEDEGGENETARTNRFIASPGELRTCIRQAFLSRGREVVTRASKNVTRTCHRCGSLEDFDQAAELVHTCSKCAATWDQDVNACINLLAEAKKGAEEEKAKKPAKKIAKRRKPNPPLATT
jgi:hypothetical protein